jgi:ankyrin repeat protein
MKWLRKNEPRSIEDEQHFKELEQIYSYKLDKNGRNIVSNGAFLVKKKIIKKAFTEIVKSISDYQKLNSSVDSIDINQLKTKINRFVESSIAAAHEKGLGIKDVLSSKLQLEYNKHIPTLLREIILLSKDEEEIRLSEEQNQWNALHNRIFDPIQGVSTRMLGIFDETIDPTLIEQIQQIGKYGCNILHILALYQDPRANTERDFEGIELLRILQFLNNKQDILTKLLEHKNDAGKTPLELAFYFNKPKQVAYLINAGANIDNLLYLRNSCTLDSLLHMVAAYGNYDSIARVAKTLKLTQSEQNQLSEEFTASQPNIRNLRNYCGKTPLHRFLSEGKTHFNSFSQILTNNNFDLEDEDGFTPLVLASQWNKAQMRVISFALVLKGANSAYRCMHAVCSPIEQTIENHDIQLLSLMLKKGANINKFKLLLHDPNVTSDIQILILLATHLSKKTLNKMLNSLDYQGNAPIHIPIIYKHPGAFRLLLDFGTNINIQNSNGLSPLDIARKYKDYEAIHILRLYNADYKLIKGPLLGSYNAYDCTKHNHNKLKLTESIVKSYYSATKSKMAFMDARTQFCANKNKAIRDYCDFIKNRDN